MPSSDDQSRQVQCNTTSKLKIERCQAANKPDIASDQDTASDQNTASNQIRTTSRNENYENSQPCLQYEDDRLIIDQGKSSSIRTSNQLVTPAKSNDTNQVSDIPGKCHRDADSSSREPLNQHSSEPTNVLCKPKIRREESEKRLTLDIDHAYQNVTQPVYSPISCDSDQEPFLCRARNVSVKAEPTINLYKDKNISPKLLPSKNLPVKCENSGAKASSIKGHTFNSNSPHCSGVYTSSLSKSSEFNPNCVNRYLGHHSISNSSKLFKNSSCVTLPKTEDLYSKLENCESSSTNAAKASSTNYSSRTKHFDSVLVKNESSSCIARRTSLPRSKGFDQNVIICGLPSTPSHQQKFLDPSSAVALATSSSVPDNMAVSRSRGKPTQVQKSRQGGSSPVEPTSGIRWSTCPKNRKVRYEDYLIKHFY